MIRSTMLSALAFAFAASTFACAAPAENMYEGDENVASTSQAATGDFGWVCNTSGGVYSGAACYCESTGVWFNPYFTKCENPFPIPPGGDFTAVCTARGGAKAEGDTCWCETARVFIDPYATTCAAATPLPAGYENQCAGVAGGMFTGSKCVCNDGRYIDPYAQDCKPVLSFADVCASKGGVANGEVCECKADGVSYYDATIDPNVSSCHKIPAYASKAPQSITICGKTFPLRYTTTQEAYGVNSYGPNSLVAEPLDVNSLSCTRPLPYTQISFNTWSAGIRCTDSPSLWSDNNTCMSIEQLSKHLNYECDCK